MNVQGHFSLLHLDKLKAADGEPGLDRNLRWHYQIDLRIKTLAHRIFRHRRKFFTLWYQFDDTSHPRYASRSFPVVLDRWENPENFERVGIRLKVGQLTNLYKHPSAFAGNHNVNLISDGVERLQCRHDCTDPYYHQGPVSYVSIARLVIGGFLFLLGIEIGSRRWKKPKIYLGAFLAGLGLICLFGWPL
jgi:hypothetical protein